MTHFKRKKGETTEQTVARLNIEAKKKKKKEVEVRPAIDLTKKPEKKGIGKRILEGLSGKTIREAAEAQGTRLIDPSLPIGVPAGALAAVGRLTAAPSATSATAVITRTATTISKIKPLTVTTQRAFVGRTAASGIDKIFHATRATAVRFGANAKSTALTTSLFKKVLNIATSPSALIAAIGTYPFAGFIKQEAIQQLGFGFNTAERNNDIEGMEIALEETRDIINAAPTILDKIPFANVLNQLKTFFEAVEKKLIIDERILEQRKAELSGEQLTTFEQSRAEARQTQLEQRAVDAEYFNLIRAGKFEEAQALLDLELKGGKTNE